MIYINVNKVCFLIWKHGLKLVTITILLESRRKLMEIAHLHDDEDFQIVYQRLRESGIKLPIVHQSWSIKTKIGSSKHQRKTVTTCLLEEVVCNLHIFIEISGASLEWVPWVPRNPWNFGIQCSGTHGFWEWIMYFYQVLLIHGFRYRRAEPMDWNS